jgi:hypothetical protein
LKPVAKSGRRRSTRIQPRLRNFLSKGASAPYLVRSIEPNSTASHDWHVQPICQRSLRALRLSGAPWIEARTPRVQASSNLLRLAGQRVFTRQSRRFCANFLRLSKLRYSVKS